jgi:hypothetical protein
MAHHLASGIVVLQDDQILLVKDKFGWGLPKGFIFKTSEQFLEEMMSCNEST